MFDWRWTWAWKGALLLNQNGEGSARLKRADIEISKNFFLMEKGLMK